MSDQGSVPPSPPPPSSPPPPTPQQPSSVYQQPPQGGRNNGLAIASMVLGILPGIFCYIVTSILAIIFGAVALNQINKSGGTMRGRGMAIAGLVLGITWVILFIVLVLIIGESIDWNFETST